MQNESCEIPSLSFGNKLFRERRFVEAIEIYRFLLNSKESVIVRQAGFNLKHCEAKLAKSRFVSRESCNISTSTLEFSASDILFKPIANYFNDERRPDRKTIIKLLNSTRKFNPDIDDLMCAIVCAQSSPFQRDLLWYVASLAYKIGFNNIYRDSGMMHIDLACLIHCASNRKYWFLNRVRVRHWLIEHSITSMQAWDLVSVPPDDVSLFSGSLPPYREKRNYNNWDLPAESDNQFKGPSEYPLALGTILLNESKFIGLNLVQHYDLCESWTLVEGACKGYPSRKISDAGLSLDNCSVQIRIFPDKCNKINYIQHGWTKSDGENAKSEMRNRYLGMCCNSKFLLVVDADEFYISKHIRSAISQLEDPNIHAVTLPQVHLWKDIGSFITGGYYDVSHTRLYRNHPGMRYIRNHNFPEKLGVFIHEKGNKKFSRTIKEVSDKLFTYAEPCCYHMGFVKDYDDMRDKSEYYINRGEATTRKTTTDCRAAWFNDDLPDNCRVRYWGGDIPEVLNYLGKEEG